MAGARPFQLGGSCCVREKKERNLEDGEKRRLDGRLEEVDEKKHVSVGGEGFEDGRVEIIEFGPS